MGIGYRNSSLKEMLEERDELLRETGCLWGLEKLELHQEDPAKMMRFQLRLLGACITSRELAKLTAASPIVRTVGECLFMLQVPEGDVTVASLGLTGHVGAAPLQIQNMIRLGYEGNPGIKPGDVFANNDPYYGSPHAADNYTFIPIFFNGELIAWSCALNHIMEVGGAIVPGSYPSLSPTSFTDGFLYPLLKVGENFITFKWFDLMWERRTRQPLFNIMDSKMRVTGAKLLHDKVLEIVEEFGVDYFSKAIREILERERRRALNVFKERTIPGIYQEVNLHYADRQKGRMAQLFPEADRTWLLARRSDIQVKSDGRVTIDLEGSNSQDYFACNSGEGGLRVALSMWWIPMVMHGGLLNTAINYVLELKAPQGSIFNPDNPYLSCTACFDNTTPLIANLGRFQARAMCSRGIIEEALVKEPGTALLEQEGVFDNGVPWGFAYFSLAGADSVGARAYKDGDTLCATHLNPESDSGEDEEFELYMPPVMLLGKTFLPDSCGHGKFRGGMGIQVVLLVVDPGKRTTQTSSSCSTAYTTQGGSGPSGGYPGLVGWNVSFHDTNMRQLMEAGEGYPSTLAEIYRWIEEGKLKVGSTEVWGINTPPIDFRDGDLHVFIACAVGGWGDPLDRDLALVEKDLNQGWVSPQANRTAYGAVAERVDGGWKVDREATAKARQQMRERRKERAVSGREWWTRERQRMMNKNLSSPVCNLYSDILKYESFNRQFTTTWQLPEDYQL
ncbi:hydantoinase B/oxoprolinase family protein [Chloroflexota bacterium]